MSTLTHQAFSQLKILFISVQDVLNRILKQLRIYILKIYHWFDKFGMKGNIDLGLIDNVLVIFIGIVIYVAKVDWLKQEPQIIYSIFYAIILPLLPIVIAINSQKFFHRMFFYLLALLLSFMYAESILEISHRDLSPHKLSLNSLTAGIVIWLFIREFSIVSLNFYKYLKLEIFKKKEKSVAKKAICNAGFSG